MSTVLFEEGDWRICRTDFGDGSAIHHLCREEYNRHQAWWRISNNGFCAYCRDKVPESIMGLWTLHNWDQS